MVAWSFDPIADAAALAALLLALLEFRRASAMPKPKKKNLHLARDS
jgi:hypothetical protein